MVDKINDSGASLIGFQELQRPQAKAFLQATEGQWKIVAGRARGREAPVNSIAYLPRLWRPTQVRYVPIEYSTWVTELPLVRFASRRGLGPIWVLNTHNPADVVGGSNALRDAAVRAEAKALRRVRASEPKAAVFFTGDMNDRARFKRRFAAKVGDRWSAANPTDDEIDWVMGGPGVTFTDVVVDQSTDDDGYRYSDHPFIHATAHLTRSDRPGRVVTRRVTRCGEA